MIAILDYGMGNLRSVSKAFERVGANCQITRDPEILLQADKLVVPGVGAFRDCMEALQSFGLVEAIRQFIQSGRYYLGLCLGMQILMDESEEGSGVPGLGMISGKVLKFPADLGLKIPHMGWNSIHFEKKAKLFQGLAQDSYVYFVHSYYVAPDLAQLVAATTDYGLKFASSLQHDNILATQFHPEKSQKVGVQIIKNFCDL